MGQKIFDVGRFQELETAIFHIGKPLPCQLGFQFKRMKRGAEQNGKIPDRTPLVQFVLDIGRDKERLFRFRSRIHHFGQRASFPFRKKTLGIFFFRHIHQRVGQGQNGLGRPVVLFKLDDFHIGKKGGKIDHIPIIGAPERINGLGIISHDHDIPAFMGKPPDNIGLNGIGILVLIHHDVAVLFRQLTARTTFPLQEVSQVDNQVVIIHELIFKFIFPVEFLQLFDLRNDLGKLDIFFRHEVVHGLLEIGRLAEDIGHGSPFWKAAPFLWNVQVQNQGPQNLFHIRAIHDGKRIFVPQCFRVYLQDSEGERMKGPP